MHYIQVCKNTQDFSQSVFFLGLFDMRPFTVLSNYFTPGQHGILAKLRTNNT